MGVSRYQARGKTFWMVDDWLKQPDGQEIRFRQRMIPTKEQAVALLAKKKAEAFEGRYFDRRKESTFRVKDAWTLYQPISERDNDTWQSEQGRAVYLLRHLGERVVASLHVGDVDEYRAKRMEEPTRRKLPPASATVDKEVELLKRMLNYAERCEKIDRNPVAKASLLRKPNVRKLVLDEEGFARLIEAAEEALRPILLVAFDTGMRRGEILNLRWANVNLAARSITLHPDETKTEAARTLFMTERVWEAIRELPRPLRGDGPVFMNPETGEEWKEIRFKFRRAVKRAGLPEDLWFHDLRRSFVTNARRRGIAESVVMRLSGHKTRAVFDRYNVVDEGDVRAAVQTIQAASIREREALGQKMVKVGPEPGPENQKTAISGGLSGTS
jgi:integrase